MKVELEQPVEAEAATRNVGLLDMITDEVEAADAESVPDDNANFAVGSFHDVVVSCVTSEEIVCVQPLAYEPHITQLSVLMNVYYSQQPDYARQLLADHARLLELLPTDEKAPVKQVDVARATAAVKAPARRPLVYCAAEFDDQCYYRATIAERVSAGNVRVYFVDYGNYHVVPINKLLALPNKFRVLPGVALRCRLEEPLPETAGGLPDWIAKVEGHKLTVKIKAIDADGLLSVETFKPQDESPLNLSQI